MLGEVVKTKRETLADFMTCPLCNKIFEKASVVECHHTFCRNCIHDKLKDEELDLCPVCKINLGASPLDKLRPETNNAQPIADQPVPSVTLTEPTKEISTSSLIPNPLVENPANNEDNSQESAQAEKQDLNPDLELVQPSTGLVQIENQSKANESNAGSSADSVNKAGDSGKDRAQENVGSSSASGANSNPIWFYLTAAQNVESPLPQIPSPYLKINNGSLTVSTLKKYVAQKLGLANEAEVEISLQGYPMSSTAQLKDLLEWWLNNSPEHSQMIKVRVGSSGKDYLMPLTYGRKSG